ncbi:hypothetical protein L486_04383 [Kwoniella mangroviensis CBS 10435]|uniref:ER transporter 6TM N-terminal domain-containing protein n=1 Tax=Kwoniella mangroviensis CBS 10435 TaxID=1331196 RepID=A0A1B9IS46_9TREE|nr:hypothetical protein L486_04383 [Kwoniella mangroviensis CBS 10435]
MPHQDDPGPSSQAPQIHITTTPDLVQPSTVPSHPSPTDEQTRSRSPGRKRDRGRDRQSSSGHVKHASFALAGEGGEENDDANINTNLGTPRPVTSRLESNSSDSVKEKVEGGLERRSWMNKVILLSRLRARKIVGHKWFKWVGPKLTWKDMRPVARGSFSSWVGLVLLLIVPVERAIGQAAFFSLIVAFMLPPSQPVVQQFEVYLNLFFFNGLAWAWVALAVFIAGNTRQTTDPSKIAAAEAKYAYLRDSNPTTYRERILYDGTYLQAKPAVVCAIFLAVGTGAALWWKLRTQPSPATFPLVLSCVLIDIGLTTAVFYPYNLYTSGLLFFLPMAIQAGLGCIATLFIFPESVGHSFQSKFPGILNPLAAAMKSIELLFQEAKTIPSDLNGDAGLLSTNEARREKEFAEKLEDWAERSKDIRQQLLQSLAGLPPLRAQQRYLNVDFSYSRLSGEDLRTLFDHLALVQARSGGMAFFFDVIVTNARHTHLDSSAWSVYKVNQSRPGSRAASIRNENVADDSRRESLADDSLAGGDGTVTPPIDHDDSTDNLAHERSSYFNGKKLHFASFIRKSSSAHGLNRDKGSHVSLLDHLRKIQQPVGVYESTRYMDIEKAFASDTEYVLEQLNILARGCLPVIRACEAALSTSTSWILNVNRDRRVIPKLHKKRQDQISANGSSEKRSPEAINKLIQVTNDLQAALDEFCVIRVEVIKPYRHLFDPNHPADEGIHGSDKTNFRGLFQNFVAQYHLIEFTEALLNLLRQMQELDKSRQRRRFWYPRMSNLLAHLRHTHKEKHLTDGDDGHDNDAAFSRGDEDEDQFLGEAKKRNPEYKPFENPYLNVISRLATITDILGSRSFMYAIKAAILGALTSLPNFIASSASFYYFNRGIWVTIMAQLTLAVFSGDTTVAWLGRVVASFWGCLFGMVAWYIGSGSGKGNAYGLAAIGAVTFPIAIFFRVHFPGQVLTAVMTPVTFGLVIGYSYFNGSIGPLTYAQWGWDVAWRRFLCVLIGITAAWIFSYIPPVYSAKRAIRHSYAQTINAAGSIFCDVLSHANDHHHRLREDDEIRQKLITWRSKLNKLGARHNFASNEYSLRGQWPEERYKALLDTLQDLFSLLSQLNHVLTQLDRPWRKALLDRTRLSDPTFLGDVLAVLSMCSTALRAGTALPQITPSPLVARFRMGKTKGLDLPHDPTDQSGDLPSLVTVDVLESDNYLRYALGITTTFSLISRLDRIVVICKTLLGENFHISGLHLEQNHRV